jgi:hypothetical protein
VTDSGALTSSTNYVFSDLISRNYPQHTMSRFGYALLGETSGNDRFLISLGGASL